jgi:hypothetical protein
MFFSLVHFLVRITTPYSPHTWVCTHDLDFDWTQWRCSTCGMLCREVYRQGTTSYAMPHEPWRCCPEPLCISNDLHVT